MYHAPLRLARSFERPQPRGADTKKSRPDGKDQDVRGETSARRPALGLLLVSVIWGTTFVVVKTALADVSPILFVGLRFSLATLASIPLVFLTRDRLGDRRDPRPDWASLIAGLPLGLVLAGAYVSQTLGLTTTTPSRSAFVTGLNVSLVPIWAFLLSRRRPGRMPLLGLALTLPGLWLLTSPQGGQWWIGDSWTLICAILYALYVVLVGRLGAKHSPGALLVSQLGATAIFALSGSFILERPHITLTPALGGAFALTAILATTGTTWLQIKLQPKVGSTRTAVIFATEPLFAALFSRLFTGEVLSASEWIGGGIILTGMLVSEIGTGRAVPERC